jgi:hypothetical protein
MAKNYSDLLVKFKDKLQKADDDCPDYGFLHACCVDFFDDIESLSTKNNKKSLEYLKLFDFNSLHMIDLNANRKLVEKNFFILASILTMTIDKYGVNTVLKELLPETIQPIQTNLFYSVINWFLSLFRETKIKLNQGSNLNEALSKAVTYLEEESGSTRESLLYLDRGGCFVLALNELCLTVIKKYGNPLKSHSLYLKMGLEIAASNKLVGAYQLQTNSNTIVSSSLSDQMSVETDYDDDTLWSDGEWYEGRDSFVSQGSSYANSPFPPDGGWYEGQDGENNSASREPIYVNIPCQPATLADSNEAASSPLPQFSPPPPPPLPLSPFVLSDTPTQADEGRVREASAQAVKEKQKALLNEEIRSAGGVTEYKFKQRVELSNVQTVEKDSKTLLNDAIRNAGGVAGHKFKQHVEPPKTKLIVSDGLTSVLLKGLAKFSTVLHNASDSDTNDEASDRSDFYDTDDEKTGVQQQATQSKNRTLPAERLTQGNTAPSFVVASEAGRNDEASDHGDFYDNDDEKTDAQQQATQSKNRKLRAERLKQGNTAPSPIIAAEAMNDTLIPSSLVSPLDNRTTSSASKPIASSPNTKPVLKPKPIIDRQGNRVNVTVLAKSLKNVFDSDGALSKEFNVLEQPVSPSIISCKG